MENKRRLIDANELIKRLQKSHEYHARNSREEVLLYRDIRIINEEPTVDAVVLPCKVGNTVWFVGTNNVNRLKVGVIETTVEKLVLKSGGVYMKLACNAMYETSCRSIGKTVFFSKEEAEAALAERAKGNE